MCGDGKVCAEGKCVKRWAKHIGAGNVAAVAVLSGGEVVRWGAQWGYGGVWPAPGLVPNIAGAVEADIGSGTACARLASGGVKCWGGDEFYKAGSLGRGVCAQFDPVPQPVAGLPAIKHLGMGRLYSLAIDTDGKLWAWGIGNAGQLGLGYCPDCQANAAPVALDGVVKVAAALAGDTNNGAENVMSLALRADGTVWGSGHAYLCSFGPSPNYWSNDTLGDGSKNESSTFIQVALKEPAVAVCVGLSHKCALAKSGVPWCWGVNAAGQLGDGTAATRATPVPVKGLPAKAIQIACGAGEDYGDLTGHTCALLEGGTVACWGRNSTGQLGNGTTYDSYEPVLVKGLSGVTQVDAGQGFSCALRIDGSVWCWGSNKYFRLGAGPNGPDTHSAVPLPVLGSLP